MEILVPILGFVACGGGFVGLIVWLIVRSMRLARERTAAMAGLAHQREWVFYPHAPHLTERFTGDPFGRGTSRRAYNVVQGTFERQPFVAFDYTYVTSSGDDSTTHHFSVVAMHLGHLGHFAPQLQVRTQGAIGRFFSSVFGTDYLIGDPAFDDAFHIQTNSPEFARDVLHPQMRALVSRFTGHVWRLQDDSLLMFRSGQHTPQEIDGVLGAMRAIIDQVPPQVWQRLEPPR